MGNAYCRAAAVKLGLPSRTAFADRVRELSGAEAMAMVEPLLTILATMARKLAVILHRMWADATEFRYGREPAGTAA